MPEFSADESLDELRTLPLVRAPWLSAKFCSDAIVPIRRR